MPKKLSIKTLDNVVANIKAMEPDDRAVLLKMWNDALNELVNDDFFGTEGQNDPRGDHRNDPDSY